MALVLSMELQGSHKSHQALGVTDLGSYPHFVGDFGVTSRITGDEVVILLIDVKPYDRIIPSRWTFAR
jgi:hypothetical protein